MTFVMGVTKYHKPVPENMQGKAKGPFPGFIPKTDELNYQSHPELVEELVGKPYYVTEKADGSSSTAFRYKGDFGVCIRYCELEESDNGFCKIANKYRLKEKLPEGIAIQWETIGPKIQGNPMGLKEVDGRAFSAYNIDEQRYLEWKEFITLCVELEFPTCCNLINGMEFNSQGLETWGEGTYHLSGKQREGVVVRSQHNIKDGKPISFKVINLNYED
jgi:RNA ligase (TIGR02306 family)